MGCVIALAGEDTSIVQMKPHPPGLFLTCYQKECSRWSQIDMMSKLIPYQ